jgi:hypothetical protein
MHNDDTGMQSMKYARNESAFNEMLPHQAVAFFFVCGLVTSFFPSAN